MEIVEALAEIVGPQHVVTDTELMTSYTTDWTGRFVSGAAAVVSPGDTQQVAAVVEACAKLGVAVHPQGGNTGLVGGSVPASSNVQSDVQSGVPTRALTVVVSMARVTWVGEVDLVAGTLTVGAGTTLEDLQLAAASAGLYYGVDIASRSSATIGGNVATNAGGVRVCAFGMTNDQVVGIEAVLPDGTVVSHLGGLEKDNTGLRWPALFVGSEGTLGIITAVTVRLHRPPSESTLLLASADSIVQVQEFIALASRSGRLLAAELMEARGLGIVETFAGLPKLLAGDAEFAVLVEVESTVVDLPDPDEVIAAIDQADRAQFWRYRELQSEAASIMAREHGVTVTKLDVSVPVSKLAPFRSGLDDVLERPGVYEFYCFGHVADGNLHIEIAVAPESREQAVSDVLELVTRFDGSISAEHGIGIAKAQYLHLSRSAAEIALMRTLKAAIDPAGRMAPGVIFSR